MMLATIFASGGQGRRRIAPCWCCSLFAVCSLIAAPLAGRAQGEALTESEANRALAVEFLDRYSLGYGLLYACGKSRLPAFLFDYQSPDELTLESAGEVSPELVKLIIDMHRDPALYDRACDLAGPMAGHFVVSEMSNELLEGLRALNRRGSGRVAFENGVYFRIRGHDAGFERYAERWHRSLEEGELARGL